MAKICKQCGVKHKNNATRCVICGTPFEDVRVTVAKKTILRYSIIAISVVLLVALALIFLTGPRAKVRQVMRYYMRGDTIAIVNTFPRFMIDSDDYSRESLAMGIAKNVEDLSNYIVSFSTDRPQSPNESDRKQIIENMDYLCGDTFEEDKLDDIKYVWVTFRGKESIYWGKTTTRFIVIKYDGHWYIWPDTFNF